MATDKSALVINRQSCPVCQSQSREILFSAKHDSPGFIDFIKFEAYFGKSFYDAYNNGAAKELLYEIAECNTCHFIYLTEVLSDMGMGLLYNEWLDKEMLKVHYSKLPYSPYQEHMLGMMKKNFSKKQQPTLMDFGAGYGVFTGMAVKKGFKTYAFDLSNDKNDFMDSMGVTIINDLKKYGNSFDVIWVNQVFEHVSDPLSIVKELRNSLTDDGLIYIAVPDCSNIKKILAEKGLSHDLFRLLSPHQHINAFTNSTLQLLGTNSGLEPLGIAGYLKLYNTKLSMAELKILIKKTIKNSGASTGLLFKKK
jgi:hypothetical protein